MRDVAPPTNGAFEHSALSFQPTALSFFINPVSMRFTFVVKLIDMASAASSAGLLTIHDLPLTLCPSPITIHASLFAPRSSPLSFLFASS